MGRRKGRAAHQLIFQVQSHLDNNILRLSGQQQRPKVRQLLAEAYIHHAATNRNDLAAIRIIFDHELLFPKVGNIFLVAGPVEALLETVDN